MKGLLLPSICFLIVGLQTSIVENTTKKVGNEALELLVVTDDLTNMVSHLTKLVVEQEKTLTNLYTTVISKLEKQEEMLSLLFKKRSKSKSTSSSKSASPQTIPTAQPSPPAPRLATTTASSAWSYSNFSWSEDHPSCGLENQSPVNLQTVDVVLKDHKLPISFSSYDQINHDTSRLVNTGNTATLLLTNTSLQPTMSRGPLNSTEYHFTQAVFHWGSNDTLGSEHTIRDVTYPMEMQLIHQFSSEEETKLAVASFIFEISQNDNPFLATIIESLASVKVAGSEVELNTLNANALQLSNEINYDTPEAIDTFSMDLLIKDSTSGPYFTYSGSLTYPPCTEVKQYIVFRTPLDISSMQLEQFRTLQQQDGKKMVNNFRPVQPLGKRFLEFTM